MRAALLLGTGGPDMLEVREDVPRPTCGPAEVLVEVSACGVNNTDINTRTGWYGSPTGWVGGLSFPRIQGADISGRVVDVGTTGAHDLVGRRVLVDPWIRSSSGADWRDHAAYLGSEVDGGFAEYCVVPATNVHPVDSQLSDVELATIACSWSTAEHMLTRVGLAAGEHIAITGASGGVGSALVQLARARGARVTAVTSTGKQAAVADLGAHEVRLRHEAPSAQDHFDVVADVVGGPDTGRWWSALRRGGRYVVSGAIAGPTASLDLRTLYLNDLTLVGATVFEPRVFAAVVRHVESGEVRPLVAASYPLERIHEAQADFEAKQHVGSIVITL